MIYEELEPIDRQEAAKELASGERERISVALLRLALFDDDSSWLEELFIRYLENYDPWVRGVSAMCLGHVARIHKKLNVEIVVPAIQRLLEDEATIGKAEDALEDIEIYIPADTRE